MFLWSIWRHLWEKKLKNIFAEFHHFIEAATGGVLQKNVFSKLLQCSRENISVGISLQTFRSAILLKRDTNTYVFLWILQNFSEHLFWRTFASNCFLFYEKDKQLILNQWKSKGFQFCRLTCLQKKFKENAYKSKQMPGRKLSRLAGTKFNFNM